MEVEHGIIDLRPGMKRLKGEDSVDDVGACPHEAPIARAGYRSWRSKRIALGEHGGDERGLAQHAVLGARQEEPREPWMSRYRCERSPQGRNVVTARWGGSGCAKLSKERRRSLERFTGWSIEPRKGIVLAERQEPEERAGHIVTDRFGRLSSWPVLMRGFIPESPADARCGSPGSARSLICRRLGDRHNRELRQTRRE
jgi:hypothetical protein